MHTSWRYAAFLFGGATLVLILGHGLYTAVSHDYEFFDIVTSVPLFGGLVILGAGFFSRRQSRHLLMAAGWTVFAGYWATQPAFLYTHEGGDAVNAVICVLGVYFLFYLAYHEYISHQRREELPALNFLAGATFVSAFFYFLIDKLPVLSGHLIKMVAEHTVWLMQLIGYEVSAGAINYGESITVPIYFEGSQSVHLILACTGLQSMMIFIGVIAALHGVDGRRRGKAFLVTVPVIYLLNIVRNVGVIYGMEVMGHDFYFMHNVVGKAGSLLALIVLAYVAFDILPELYDNIVALVDLPKRQGPVERLLGRVMRR